ncbi:hypothetical protein R4769_17990, partial [Azotobacter beijerinckii]|nr:hypothetical protein [Azotobacter beijerinckii]
MKSTAEQLPVIHYEGNHLVVKAYAGCGKTTTLVAYAEHHSHLRMLYLAYNRAIRDEGAAKFPRNVVCKTSHQLAWPGFGQRYQHKLGNVRLTDAAGLLETRHWGSVRDALAVLTAYLASADREIGLAHALAGLDGETFAPGGDAHIERTIGSAQRLWEADSVEKLATPADSGQTPRVGKRRGTQHDGAAIEWAGAAVLRA